MSGGVCMEDTGTFIAYLDVIDMKYFSLDECGVADILFFPEGLLFVYCTL